MFSDAHAHLTDAKYCSETESIVKKCIENNVRLIVNSGFDLISSVQSKELSEKHDEIYFTAGVHPDEARTFDEKTEKTIIDLSSHKKCVGIGEIGFDFYWNKSTEEEQARAFERQMEIADDCGKPFVVHSRNACQKTLDFLKNRKTLLKNGFLMHCYSESEEIAEEYLKLGAYFSFGGVITFKNAKKDGIVRSIPFDRILTETDSPYLSPEPFRGTVNDPSRIPIICKKVAEFKGVAAEEAEKITEENFKRFYRV